MSSPRRLGLPGSLRLRHDAHFVDQLGRPSGSPLGRLVPVEDLDPNPQQPRRTLGDLSELTASIHEKGVLEPILVRPQGGRFEIIAGERRYRAACKAGLDEVPCIVRTTPDSEMMELALIENLQRKDLSPFEEADGLRNLGEAHGYTHEMMAKKLGKSRSSITEALSLAAMPESVRSQCRRADIGSKSLLLQIVRQEGTGEMLALLQRFQSEGPTRAAARRLAREAKGKPPRGRPRGHVHKCRSPENGFSLTLQFKRARVSREEIVKALELALDEARE